MNKIEEKFFRVLSLIIAKYIFRKPDYADVIYLKYNSFSAIYKMAMNYILFRLRSKKSFKIVSIIFESTNTCTLKCRMCPTRDKMTRKRGIMDYNLYTKIIDQNPSVKFVHICLWGEPLLNPNIIKMIKYAKSKGLEVDFYSNATLLNKDLNRELLQSGLDRITFSLDGVGEVYTQTRGFPYETTKNNILNFVEDRKLLKSNTAIYVSCVVSKETESSVPELKKTWEPLVDAVKLQPENTYNQQIRKDPCFELWRGNMIIHWDGTVVPCCVDFDGTLKLGDANTQTLEEIFNGPELQKLRLMQKQGKFPKICDYCTEYETKEISPRFN